MKSLARFALACASAVTLTANAAFAQEASTPQALPRPERPLVSVALDAAAGEPQEPARTVGFGAPIVRIGRDYVQKADEDVREVRAAFSNVTVTSGVDQDVVVFLGTLRLAASASVKGSVIVFGGSAVVDEGAVVDRDLVVVGGTLTAPPGFAPGGNHVVVGSPALGDAVKALVPWLTRGLLLGRLIVPDLSWTWIVLGLAFLVTLAVNVLFDGTVRASAETLAAKPVTVFLVGLLVLVLTVPVITILGATVVGLAVVPFLLAAMVLAGLVGKAGVARAIGSGVIRQTSPDSRLLSLRSFLIGAIVITLAYMIPVLGIVTWSLTGGLAIGAAAITMRTRLRRELPARVHAPRPALRPQVTVRGAQVPEAVQAPHEALAEGAPPSPLEAATAEPEARANAGSSLALFPRASFLDRVMAFALDCVLIGIVVLVLDLPQSNGVFPLLLLVYHLAFWAWKGTTLGGIVIGLRIIRMRGGDPRFADALVRVLSSLFSLGALGIGCFWMLQDSERQMWHDKIAGTVVVKVPRELALT